MNSREPNAGGAGSSPYPASLRQLDIAQIDLRFKSLRLASPQDIRRLKAAIQSDGRIREPLLVSTGVAESSSVLVDGFKRLRVAEELGLQQVSVQQMQLDVARAVAAILQYNEARHGLCHMEEAWIVHALREQGMKQADIAELLKRPDCWVSRRLALAKSLEPSLQDDIRLGLLSATTARELVQLPRGKQLKAAQAVREHHLSSRQSTRLVRRLQQAEACDPQASRDLLEDPLRYLAANGPKSVSASDPRLSEDGNRQRRVLISWQDACAHVSRELRRHPAVADAQVLVPVLKDAVRAGEEALRQLKATLEAYAAQSPPKQSEQGPDEVGSDA